MAVHTERGAYTRRCTQKGGLWPPQESCYLGGHRHGGTHRTRCLHKAVHTKRRPVATAGVMLFRGPQAWRYTQNAVPTQGGAHKRRSIATAGVMLFRGPQAWRYTQNAVPTQGGAHKKAACGHRRSHVI